MRNSKLTPAARALRKNMTPQERHLWYDFLLKYPVKFRRQEVIGRFIVDFYSPKTKLVIELDGSQHYSQEGMEHDRERTAYLEGLGCTVIRFSNHEVDFEFQAVCEKINHILFPVSESPHPARRATLPVRRGGLRGTADRENVTIPREMPGFPPPPHGGGGVA